MTPLLALTIRSAEPAIGVMLAMREHLFLLGLSRLIYGLPHQTEESFSRTPDLRLSFAAGGGATFENRQLLP